SPPKPAPTNTPPQGVSKSSFIPHPSSLPPLPPSPPPPRDCSPTHLPQPAARETNAPLAAVTPSPSTPSDNLPPTASAARNAFLAPAHPSNNDGHSAAVTELKITPQTLGFSTKKHSNRRERRRLHRLATTK